MALQPKQPAPRLETRHATRDVVIPGMGTVQAGWEGEVDVNKPEIKPLLTKALVPIKPALEVVPDKATPKDAPTAAK